MCGIGGIVWSNKVIDRKSTVLRCCDALGHRGPDEWGIYVDDYLGFAHTRLAIIAPESGHQPYAAADAVLVFNGEIFNFRDLKRELASRGNPVASDSDTAVLYEMLRRDGKGAVERLNGQFAFCYYDPADRSLLLARDAMGEKPLYYTLKDGAFAFSSEIKGLMALLDTGLELDPVSIAEINSYWAHDPAASCFKSIGSVPPGAVLEYRDGAVRMSYYKAFRRSAHPKPFSAADARTAVSDAVERRMIADVPLGVYLSGGLDSSIVSYEVVRRSRSQVRSYAIEFRDERFDEARYQHIASKWLGTSHRALSLDYADLVDNLTPALRMAESPSFRTGFVGLYLLSDMVSRDGIKVILTGEGADEVFLGYDLFWQVYIRERIRAGATLDDIRDVLERINSFVVSDVDRSKYLGVVYANAKRQSAIGSPLASHTERVNLGRPLSQMFSTEQPRENSARRWLSYFGSKYPGLWEERELQQAQAIETETLLSGHLLSIQGDRASMAHSVETRAPFLDTELVAATYSADMDVLLDGRATEKHILKQAYKDVLPPEIASRQKFPYRAPDGFAFLNGKGRDFCYDLVAGRKGTGSVVDIAKFERFLDATTQKASILPRDSHTLIMGLTTLAVEAIFSEAPGRAAIQRDHASWPARSHRTSFGEITRFSAPPRH